MFDLKTLEQVSGQLQQSNHQQSESILSEALQLLELSLTREEPFCPDTLLQAAEKVQKALTLDSKSLPAHMLLAYIMLLTDQLEGASFFIQKAEILAPENNFVALLKSQLRVCQDLQPYKSSADFSPQLPAEVDFEALYTQNLRVSHSMKKVWARTGKAPLFKCIV